MVLAIESKKNYALLTSKEFGNLSSMFKLIRLLLLLLLVVIVAVVVYFWLGRVERTERFLTKQLRTKVTIEAIDLGWNKLTVRGLKIANPPNSKLPYAFQSNAIQIRMSPFEFFQQTVNIDKLSIQSPTIAVELYNGNGSDNNWTRLLNAMQSKSSREKESKSKSRSSASKEKNFIITKLSITDLQFDILRSNGKKLSIPPIPLIELDNLGSDNPLTMVQLSRVLFQVILQNISTNPALQAILDDVVALPGNLLRGVTSNIPLKEKVGEAIQEGVDTLRRKGKEAGNYLQDLFSK